MLQLGAAGHPLPCCCHPPSLPLCFALCDPQTSDFMVFDWKPELGTLLHVVPLHGGQVGAQHAAKGRQGRLAVTA